MFLKWLLLRRLFYLFWLFIYLFTKQSTRTQSASSTDHEIFQLHLLIGIISHRVRFLIMKRKIVGKCWSESLREIALVSRQYNNYTHVPVRNIPKFKDRASWSRDTFQPMRRRACVYQQTNQNIAPVIKNFQNNGRSRRTELKMS